MATNRMPRAFNISREKEVYAVKKKNKMRPFLVHYSSRLSVGAAFMLPNASLTEGTFQMHVMSQTESHDSCLQWLSTL